MKDFSAYELTPTVARNLRSLIAEAKKAEAKGSFKDNL